MRKETGGPAFPRNVLDHGHGIASVYEPGMTLRDYFAANAPISLCDAMSASGMGSDFVHCLQSINCGNGGRLMDEHSRLCYQWADAMLKERDK